MYNNSATSYSLKNKYTMKLINIILMQWYIDAWHLNCYDYSVALRWITKIIVNQNSSQWIDRFAVLA